MNLNNQEKFQENILILQDILLSELSAKKYTRVRTNLKEFAKSLESLFTIKDKNKYTKLMLNIRSEKINNDESWENEDYSKTFNLILDFFEKIYKRYIDVEDDNYELEIQMFSANLRELILKSEKTSFINTNTLLEQYLETHSRISNYSISKEDSIYSEGLVSHWYTSDIFNWYIKEENFPLDFLSIYDKYLMRKMVHLIDKNKFKLFKETIEWFHSGIGFHNLNDFYFYVIIGFDNENLYDKGRSLEDSYQKVNSIESLKEWIKEFHLFKEEVLKTKGVENELLEIEKKAYQSFFFKNLKLRIREICAYLIYKEKYDWIDFMWSFMQPKESKSIHIGHSILLTADELVGEFNKTREPFKYNSFFRDGRKDFRYFVQKYDLLFLWRELDKDKKINMQTNNKTESDYERIKYYIKELKEFDEMDKYQEFFKLESFDSINLILDGIISQCDNNINKIVEEAELNNNKLNEFKKDFMKRYNNVFGLLLIYKDFVFKYKKVKEKSENNKFGLNTLLPKDMFVRSNIFGDMVASDLAKGIIEGINTNIYKLIKNNSIVSKELDFFYALKNFNLNEDSFILCVNTWTEIRNDVYFEDKYKDINGELNEINSYIGIYKYQETSIPVFMYNDSSNAKEYIIINKNKLPIINRYELIEDDIIIEKVSSEVEKKLTNGLDKEDKDKKVKELDKNINFKAFESIEFENVEDSIGVIYEI